MRCTAVHQDQAAVCRCVQVLAASWFQTAVFRVLQRPGSAKLLAACYDLQQVAVAEYISIAEQHKAMSHGHADGAVILAAVFYEQCLDWCPGLAVGCRTNRTVCKKKVMTARQG